ncbi:alpha/beta fold hydrolase [Mycobacterium sp. MUNTM1]
MTAPQTLTFDLPHLRVSALAWGPPDGRLLLCLHGFPDTAWTYRRIGPLLGAKGFRVVAPFSRGYSPTQIPDDGDYHIGALMFDALAVHRHLGSPADAVLMGHDWGGFTALALAAHPDSPFATVVGLAAPWLYGFRRAGPRVLGRLASQARRSWYVLYQQLPALPEHTLHRVIGRLWRDWSPPGYDTAADLNYVQAALPDRAHRSAALSYYRHQFQPRRHHAAYRLWHRSWRRMPLRVPVLLLHGGLDGALDPELAALSAGDLPNGSTHAVLAGGGHFPQLDLPELVTQLIADHIMCDTAQPGTP